MDRIRWLTGIKFWILTALVFCLLENHLVFAQQRQRFHSSPRNQEVIEGSTSMIDCEVHNQRGRVQWAKDGFVLGFNRTIPGYPRYEMVGTGDDGTHHLMIKNTTLVDDADYQCQVGPADGHPPIRATGRLTVLMAPSVIKLHSSGHEDEIEVNDGDQVTLECLVQNAKPVAKIRWFKNDVEIKLDNRKDNIQESFLERRHDVISKIASKLTSLDDGSHYICQADHQALDKPMRASVRISVLYPPGPPIISGYTEGENIRANEERVLTCRSKGGNPLARVTWYRNNEIVNSIDKRIRGESVNEYRFLVEARDNGATFTCEVKNKLTKQPLLSSVTLSVLFPPEKVEVSGPTQARLGENVTLTCYVENTNPPATISWVVDGKPDLSAKTTNDRAGGGGWHSVSTLTMPVPPVDRNIMFTCHATNEALGKTSIDTFMLSVLRPPQAPEIYGYSEGIGIKVGQEQSLSCVSRGGNPSAHLQWFRNGVKIPSEKHSVAEVSTAKISIQAEPHDNGVQYRCEAHNAAATAPLSFSTTLIVYYPPKSVKVKVHPEYLQSGSQATLTCEAGPSNPPVEIAWLRGGFKLNGHLEEVQDAPNQGSTVINVLVLNLTAADDGLTYTCQALNSALQKKEQNSVTLRVKYPPQFVNTAPKVVDAKIGDSLVLNLTARGNPDTVSYTWTHQGIPLPKAVIEETRRGNNGFHKSPSSVKGPRVSVDGPILRVKNVSVHDAGDYELEATNAQGSTVAQIYFNVQYPVVIRGTSGTVRVSEGDDATVECQAEGNPLNESMMKWHRLDYNFINTQQSFGNNKAVLKIPHATRNDTGVFTCVFDNGIGKSVRANVSLIVNAQPLMSRTELWSLSAAEVGSTGRLRCEAEGSPEIQFSWRKKGVQIISSAYDEKYWNKTTQIDLVTWSSTLEIRNVKTRDFGYYDCVATNALGKSTHSIQFTAPTKPKPPLSLKIVNTTHDSATLEWVPGFDGGATQYFRLRYRQTTSQSPFEFVDVYEPNTLSYTVTGLRLDAEYYFSIMSRNANGDSAYMSEFVRAKTLSEAPPTPIPSSNVGREVYNSAPLPALWVVIIVLVALALLTLNVSAIVCIIRRKRRKRGGNTTEGFRKDPSIPLSSSHQLPSFGSDLTSSKSTTNTMYAPSSYNDTVVGETLSSISEKSRESYNQEDSVGEYEDHNQKHSSSSYLIDQIDPPPEYASQTPSSTAYDPNEDDYAEILRRNAYNHQLGKGTPRPPSRATHYSASPESRGYISYSYTPSPTGIPNGGTSYPQGATLRLSVNPVAVDGAPHVHQDGQHRGSPYTLSEGVDGGPSMIRALGLDSHPPPPMSLEQHSITSEHPSLTLDPHSITIDHPVTSDGGRDLRVQTTPLSTFHPTPSPSEMEGHLV